MFLGDKVSVRTSILACLLWKLLSIWSSYSVRNSGIVIFEGAYSETYACCIVSELGTSPDVKLLHKIGVL
jgi:hypothetical protein